MPMIEQVKMREEKVQKYEQHTKKLFRHVKMLAATLELPIMTDLYRRACKRKLDENQ